MLRWREVIYPSTTPIISNIRYFSDTQRNDFPVCVSNYVSRQLENCFSSLVGCISTIAERYATHTLTQEENQRSCTGFVTDN